ncbi:outer membrane beta-barrel protein [Roseivirga sp.]|uniref:outer membrane beta-barrel protein n=1 Tax=Roseivirga sp. TaxID=1964215 RepID=UPI003B8B0FCA
MKKFLIAFTGLFLMTLSVKAQRPDLPGALIVDIGINNWGNAPDNVNLNSIQSKTVGITYFYDIPLGNRGFTFTPGIGLGLEKYSLEDNFTLTSSISNSGVKSISTAAINNVVDDGFSFGKSKVAMNYVDVPLELRWYASGNRYNTGFRAAIGAKVGVLYSSFTKIRFEDTAGDENLIKNRQDLGLNRFRYGIQGRIGFGGFSLFGFYELSDKWDTAPAGGTTTQTLTFGISLTGF